MQYVRYLLIPSEGTLHPLECLLAEDALASREAIHHLSLLADGTLIGLYECSGELSHLRESFVNHPDMLSYRLSKMNSTVYAHVHTRPTDTVRQLLEIQNEHTLITDMPIEYTSDGNLRLVSLGRVETFQAVIEEMPPAVEIQLEGVGQWRPASRRPFTQLTQRQQEVLHTAAALDYFDEPRGTTHEEIAREMDLAPETVGEHLRKAQATLVEELLP